MKTLRLALAATLMAVAAIAMAQTKLSLPVWTSTMPHDTGHPDDVPMMHVFLPDSAHATGRAVVICPGGGYGYRAMDHEGYDWAPYFNHMGIAAIVLYYRLPYAQTLAPIADAQQAIRMARQNAKAWHINPNDVGIMGFSAGGHLASSVATHSSGDAAPDFQILFYPVISMDPQHTHMGSHDNLLGANATKQQEELYTNHLQVNSTTPRALLMLSADDDCVPPINSLNYYMALNQHHVPAAMHIYPHGNHGWGMNTNFRYHAEMLMELTAWLHSF